MGDKIIAMVSMLSEKVFSLLSGKVVKHEPEQKTKINK